MQRNTFTTLSELRAGDRFTFPGRADTWEVVNPNYFGKVLINQFAPNRTQIHKDDHCKRRSQKVRFLRHTAPLPGEEGLINEMKVGDVFHSPEDIINEYILEEQRYPRLITRSTATGQVKEFDWMAWGVIVTNISITQKLQS